MRKSMLRLLGMAGLWTATLFGCNFLSSPALPTQTSPTAVEAMATQTPAPQPAATQAPDDPQYGSIRITGSSDFIRQTRLALALLEAQAPEAYRKIQAYVGIISQGEHSGIWAWEQPPRYEVGDRTAFSSVTWYASTIAHDATHSELYHNHQEWEGIAAEKFCNAYQLMVLKQIGAPASEIDYMASLDGDHCDLDNDGDCDQADYEKRDW